MFLFSALIGTTTNSSEDCESDSFKKSIVPDNNVITQRFVAQRPHTVVRDIKIKSARCCREYAQISELIHVDFHAVDLWR